MPAPTHRARAALAERLRDLRRAAGMTGEQFAERLGAGWGQPKISRLETGKRLPAPNDLHEWAAATGADAHELLAMLTRARAEYATYREAGGPDIIQQALARAEAAATTITEYQPVLVPGLLQTADYAREMLQLPGGPADATGDMSEDDLDRMIAARLRRQAILYEPGRDITLLMGEGALLTRVASPAVMRAQLDHIAHLAQTLRTATIGIVPFTARIPIAVLNGWTILDNIVTIETDGGDLDIADPEEVKRYQRNTQLLLNAAATGIDAAELCRRAKDDADSSNKQ